MDAAKDVVVEANRASWNRIAPRRPAVDVARFGRGELTLDAIERELAGDVTGRRVLQLACSHGDDVLSWAVLGADATGIDLSVVAIDIARRRAAQAGIVAEFRRADMLDLPADLGTFDVVHLSWGAICWAPDLSALAGALAARLRPGGAVVLADHHPLWEVLAVRGDNALAVAGDYFGRGRPRTEHDDAKLPRGARGEPDAPPFAVFVWPVSDVVMALIGAGLRLERFVEAAAPSLYAGLGPSAQSIPAYYAIRATRANP